MTTNRTHKLIATTHGLAPIGGAQPIPDATVPAVPGDFDPTAPTRSLAYASSLQVSQAPTAVTELRATTSYVKHLGESVVSPTILADALDFSSRWSAIAKAADAYSSYANRQAQLAWDATLTHIKAVHPLVVAAGARDPAFEAELSAFFTLVTARNAVARRTAARRRASEAAKRAAARKVAAPPTPVATATAPTAASVAAPPVVNAATPAGGAHA